MVKVTVTLENSHKTAAGYVFLFGEDRVFSSENTFRFEIESLDNFCEAMQTKLDFKKLELIFEK